MVVMGVTEALPWLPYNDQFYHVEKVGQYEKKVD